MRYLLLSFLIILCLSNLQCGSNYWSYHMVKAPAHIINCEIIPVWIDSGFSQTGIDQIQLAIKEWNLVLNGQIKIVLMHLENNKLDTFTGFKSGMELVKNADKTGLGWVIFALREEDKSMEGVGEGVLAWVEPGEHFINVVVDRIGTRNFKTIMLHEINN